MSNNALENSHLLKVRLGKIKGIKVCNFKLFENEHYMGPFTKFTSIIRPTGGGKSSQMFGCNLICVGNINKVSQRRGINQQLINEDDPTAFVEIIFDAINHMETQISLKRRVNKSQQTQIVIGEKETEKELSSFLFFLKYILPAKNFVMLQSDTDTLTTIEPKKLTELFEYIIGRECLIQNTCQAELNKVVVRMRELQFQRGAMRIGQKKIKELKSTSDKYKKISEEINQLKLNRNYLNQNRQIMNSRMSQNS